LVTTTNMPKRFCIYAVGLALACTSCGDSGLYPVRGHVTYKGTPAAGAAVHFYRAGANSINEQSIMGIVAQDGSFELVCGHLGKGAPPGEYDVLIEWRQGPNEAKGLAHKVPDKFKGRYANPKRPLLHAVVKPESNSLPTIELTD
jgi:hypothetical protein